MEKEERRDVFFYHRCPRGPGEQGVPVPGGVLGLGLQGLAQRGALLAPEPGRVGDRGLAVEEVVGGGDGGRGRRVSLLLLLLLLLPSSRHFLLPAVNSRRSAAAAAARLGQRRR